MIINSIDIIGTFTYYKENFFNVKITIVPQLRYSVWISGKGLNGAIIEEIYSDKMEINPGESKSIKLSIFFDVIESSNLTLVISSSLNSILGISATATTPITIIIINKIFFIFLNLN